jgi:predicted CXXCH cytochrome family protein
MKKGLVAGLVWLAVVGIMHERMLCAGSFLQISAEPGVSIWMNGQSMGKTGGEEQGMVLRDLEPGDYLLKAARSGYKPVETVITVGREHSVEWHVVLARPAMQVEDAVLRLESTLLRSEPTGTMVLQSIPLNADIFLNGKSIGKTGKKITFVPAGSHTIRFALQQQHLEKQVDLQEGDSLLLRADFMKSEVVSESDMIGSRLGAATIIMQTARRRKPAQFPHRKHQDMFKCAACHHGMDSLGGQLPYTEGMDILRCAACHNPASMENRKLSSLKLAAHTLCKGCHRKTVAAKGTAGPIDKCTGCHNAPEER